MVSVHRSLCLSFEERGHIKPPVFLFMDMVQLKHLFVVVGNACSQGVEHHHRIVGYA
jgi:hypothetical protein